jgi:YD repeat-containing protein
MASLRGSLRGGLRRGLRRGLRGGLLALAFTLLPATGWADDPLPSPFRARHELQAQGEGSEVQLTTRSTYLLPAGTRQARGEQHLSFASPVSWPIEVVAPEGARLVRDAAGRLTEILVPEGQSELVVTSTQLIPIEEAASLPIPLVGADALELVVVTGGDAARIEPSPALGFSRHVGYSASARVTEDEGAAFAAWRTGQRLGQQYLLVRIDRASPGGPGLAGRLTTRGSRARPFVLALVVVALAGAVALFVLRKRLERAAIEEEADAILEERFADLQRQEAARGRPLPPEKAARRQARS